MTSYIEPVAAQARPVRSRARLAPPTTEELTHDHHTVRELPSVPVW